MDDALFMLGTFSQLPQLFEQILLTETFCGMCAIYGTRGYRSQNCFSFTGNIP